MEDLRLLREYAQTRSEAAFARVVSRHIDMVYGVCLRQLRHSQDAEDATQAVFLHLAHKASQLRDGTIVAAWLHHVARMESAQSIRKATIRRRHEMAAASQAAGNRPPPPSGHHDHEIDRALRRLRTTERAAVLLRFFRGQSFQEIAAELRISEEAARKRVGRAVEKLRALLRPSEGSVLSAAGVEAILHAGAHRAPATLAAATVKAVAAHALPAVGASVTKGAIVTMAISKTNAALVGIAAVLLVGGTVAVNHYIRRGREEAVVIQPAATTAVITSAPAPATTYNGPPVVGFARLPDGTPVARADVFVSDPDHFLSVYDYEHLRQPHLIYGTIRTSAQGITEVKYGKDLKVPLDIPAPVQATTGADGKFKFTPTQLPVGLVVRGAQGMGIATAADVASGRPLIVKPWARIEGTNRVGVQPVPKADVRAINLADVGLLNAANVTVFDSSTSDADGHFIIERAMPGLSMINRTFAYRGDVFLGRGGKIEFATFPPGIWLTQLIDLQPGQTNTVRIGGTGRPITGHVAQRRDGYVLRRGSLSADPPLDFENSYPFDFTPDGTFLVHDMPAGRYHLHADFAIPAGRFRPLAYKFIDYVASGEKDFVVPPIPGGRSDEPLDIGQVPLTPLRQLTPGQAPPELDLRTLEGSPRRLSDFRGKYLLLQIWSASRRYIAREQEHLRAIYDRFGVDPGFGMLGVNVDQDPRASCKTAIEAGVLWPQTMLASPSDGLPDPYKDSGSSLYLIDPQGNLLAKDLDDVTAYGTIEQLLGRTTLSPRVLVERELPNSVNAQTPYHAVPAPTWENAAYGSSVTIVDGKRDGNSGPLQRIVDGRTPASPDAPGQSFFFDMGSLEGRFRIDLRRVVRIARISTYSWHPGNRAPQVYRVYGSDGSGGNFDCAPKIGTDPATCGWTQIAAVDTRPTQGPFGGRYAVNLLDPAGSLGRYRYLLFAVFVTQTRDDWGQTFYGEVNVVEKQ